MAAPTVKIYDHHDGHGLNESLNIEASNSHEPSGAYHDYTGTFDGDPLKMVVSVYFQKGPRNEPGSRAGCLEAALLAIVAHRMRCFQEGEYKCRENALVLTKIEEALHWLKHRADDRKNRGVLGTHKQ
jgi:hypothetical protein